MVRLQLLCVALSFCFIVLQVPLAFFQIVHLFSKSVKPDSQMDCTDSQGTKVGSTQRHEGPQYRKSRGFVAFVYSFFMLA